MKTLVLLVLIPLCGCATKTDPSFLQNAAAALYGVSGGVSSPGGPLAAPQRHSSFDSFFAP